MTDYIVPLADVGMNDVQLVGGKNASLGEMISQLTSVGINVPDGFATTSTAYHEFLKANGLADLINAELDGLDVSNLQALKKSGQHIRQSIIDTPFSATFTDAINNAYQSMLDKFGPDLSVAVRSSATAEDLPEASFAGQQETFLNVQGAAQIMDKIKQVFASLYTDRAIAYRVHHGFDHHQIALSAAVQKMVRSDLATSGVIFTLDTESGFQDVVFITANYGLGETIVQGTVDPDEFYVYKPALAAGRSAILHRHCGRKAIRMVYGNDQSNVRIEEVAAADRMQFSISDEEVAKLASLAVIVEQHYGKPMDIEWAKDGIDGKFYLIQARPETVQSRRGNSLKRYSLKESSRVITQGRSIGERIGAGSARVIATAKDMQALQEGEVLITDMTDPDWEPLMQRAAAIVTNRGGRTCHAAIVARELGVPTVVGCGDATEVIHTGDDVTVSCAKGDIGYVYEGILNYDIDEIALDQMPTIPVKMMLNVGNPNRAFSFSMLPNAGIGLARMEFIINNMIGIHPKALLEYETLDPDLKTKIAAKINGYANPMSFFVEKLSEGISTLAAAFAPKPVIVRLSDFKSNEYANLLGGDRYEPREENPMLGFRGTTRYLSDAFKDCFELECRALLKVRNDMGLENVQIMVPFVRTLEEARQIVELLAEQGLRRGEQGLKIIMMCEIPSNAILAEEFLENFDGFSIGSNDLTQLTLGLDRDSEWVADLFNEQDPAVLALIKQAIQVCRERKKYIGICGQGPSDHPEFARWLLEQGIESLSLNPDSVIGTWLFLAR